MEIRGLYTFLARAITRRRADERGDNLGVRVEMRERRNKGDKGKVWG